MNFVLKTKRLSKTGDFQLLTESDNIVVGTILRAADLQSYDIFLDFDGKHLEGSCDGSYMQTFAKANYLYVDNKIT